MSEEPDEPILPDAPFLDESTPVDAVELGAAMMFVRRHGVRTPALIAARILALEKEGDRVGAALWRRIGTRADEILRGAPDN